MVMADDAAVAGSVDGPARAASPSAVRNIIRVAVTVSPDATVGEARRLLRQPRIRHLPVLDRGLLVGIVAGRDLQSAPGEATRIAAVMTRTVFFLSPETPVRSAARIFRERRFGAMPVLRGRELVGIVSVVDVARTLDARPRVDGGGRPC